MPVRIKVTGEVQEFFRAGSQDAHNRLIKGNPDRHLNQHRQDTTDISDPGFFKESSLFLRQTLFVFSVFLLQFLDLGLHVLHFFTGKELFFGQRIHCRSDKNGKNDNCQPGAIEKIF